MRIFGLVGWDDSAKTQLAARLVPALVGRGLRVSAVCDRPAGVAIDRTGKDSDRHRRAGAREVVLASARRWALVHAPDGTGAPDLESLIARLAPVDVVLVEGFEDHPHERIEVHRARAGRRLLYPDDPRIVALASDACVGGASVPVLPLDDTGAIADFIARRGASRAV